MKRIIFGILNALFIASVMNTAYADQGIPEYSLSVSFDILNSKITGTARTDVVAGEKATFNMGPLTLLGASLNGRRVGMTIKDGTAGLVPDESGALEMVYYGVFKDKGASDDINPGVTGSVIDRRGVSLTGTWYPQREGLCRFRLTAALPKGYEAVSEAEKIEKAFKGDIVEFSFSFPHPVDGISFIASDRFEITRDSVNGIELYAYFFHEDQSLAKTYLGYTKKYMELYENMLSKYPYSRFSVVENFLPTGYSMPAFTLLGQDVVRLPFIVETSLGHEILHQWFGNSVYADYDKGNWSEGLTSYLADHLYDERKGKGWEHRKQMLINYEAYVNEKNEFALADFKTRADLSSRAIGYGKAAMTFHMLKSILGDVGFKSILRGLIKEKSFQRASWDDIRREAEKASGGDLGGFFDQWVKEKGLPRLLVEDASLRQSGSKFELKLTISRKGGAYDLNLPAVVTYVQGVKKSVTLLINKDKNVITMMLDFMPERISFDENYDLARRLTDDEIPPVIGRMIGDAKPLLVMPVASREAYTHIIGSFVKKGAVRKDAAEIKDSDVKSSTLVIMGSDSPLIGRLFGKAAADAAGFSIIVRRNPWNPDKVVGIIHARSLEEADAAFRKIFHYGKYSRLSFENGKNTLKEIEASGRGMIVELGGEAPAVEVPAVRTLPAVIERVIDKKIVYVGEFHDRFSSHNVELRVMQAFYDKGRKIAIGMEMFQRPFQSALDEYISGKTDEREFLKKSEYFKRWGFDYNLYKPILDFARERKIPVVALNVKREIIDKVSKEGMDSLSTEERKEIPPDTDFSDSDYRARLKDIFDRHEAKEGKDFNRFYQAQILWDETMSLSIDEFLRKNPEFQMIAVAGGGHLAYGSGIPKRTFRRNGLDYAVILSDVEIEEGIADYIVYPRAIEGATAPKLMAILKEDGDRLSFRGFSEGSVSLKAGIKAGDVLLSIDGVEIKNMGDVKLALFYKKAGDTVRISVKRKRFLLGDTEKAFDVKL